VLYVDIERFWKKGRKEGAFLPHVGPFQGQNIRSGTARNIGTGLRPDRDSYAMLSSFGRCYMWKDGAPFHFNPVYRPRKAGRLCRFSSFCPPTSRPYLFNAWPIWVNFMSNQRVFRALRRHRAILEERTKKRGPFFLMWGLFRAKILESGTARNIGYSGFYRTEIRTPCCPRSVDATRGRMERRFISTPSIAPQSRPFVPSFAFCPPTSTGDIFSTAWPIWVNFMSNQRVFRALRRHRAILEERTKEGAFLPHVGPF